MNRSTIADEILGYLANHPGAQDTVEGIQEWWLLKQRIRPAVAAVKKALAELVAQGLVAESRSRDGRWHYRAKRRKEREPQLEGETFFPLCALRASA
jgi:hypothetical protein